MARSRSLAVAILLPSAALLAAGSWYFAAHRHKASPAGSSTSATPADSAVPASANSAGANTTSPAAVSISGTTAGDIQFIPREDVASITLSDKTDDDEVTTTYNFYRVGRFVRGPNQGAELLLAQVSWDISPCKGGCDQSAIVRYIRKDSVVFPLPRISDPHAPGETVGRKAAIDARPFSALKATLGQASEFDVPALDYPEQIVTGGAVLQRRDEGIGVANAALLQLAFHDQAYGDVWMTKPGLGPQKAFFERCEEVNPSTRSGEGGCTDLPQFTDNAFYFFRPDGTYLSYVYKPDFNREGSLQVTWNDGPLPGGISFRNVTLAGCGWSEADAVSVVAPALVSESDLDPIGKVTATGEAIYGLKDKNHPLYKEFYKEYDSSFPAWARELPEDARQVSYGDFVKAHPLFVWKDPFGRLIRFVNTRFVMPNACEPILYLYPPQQEDIQLNLGEDVVVINSYPAYHQGWSVSARPDGELTDLGSGRRVPYLFWEGHSYLVPSADTGFLVKSSDIATFLAGILPRLGLNAKETRDFSTAWSPRLNQSPYYLITFLDRPLIDRLYPVRIDPPPDTMIRVLMDFKPLSEPISVTPPVLAPVPQRRGFTVVEWGVLVH